MKNKVILVTGGAGFIGSHLVRRLVREGAKVVVVVKYRSMIDSVRLAPVWDEIEVVEADLRNLDSAYSLSDRAYDVIFHLAAYNHVGDSFTHVQESLQSNILATANLMEAGIDYQRFIYIASSEVYGFQEEIPFTETATPFPISPYAIGKHGGELYAKMKQHQTSKEIVCLRPFNTFGPYQSERAVIPEFIIKCLNGVPVELTKGTQTREFNFVENIVDGMLLAAGVDPIPVGSINLGSGEEIAIRDLVQRILELTGSQSELRIGALENRPTEIWRMQADFSQAKEMLGWESVVGFDEGLKRTVDWYRKFLDVFGSAGLAGL